MTWLGRHPRWFLATTMLVALAWRLLIVSRTPCIETDGAYYGVLARRAVEGGWRDALDPAWPPLFPWVTAWVARLLEAPSTTLAVERAGFLVSAVTGALILWPTWELARGWRGTWLANTAVVLLGFHPRAVRYSAAAVSESLFVLLFVTAFWAFDAAGRPGRPEGRPEGRAECRARVGFGVCGLLVALSILARPEGWVAGGVYVAALCIRRPRASRGLAVLAFLLPFAVILAPWLGYLHGQLGTWSPGAKGSYNFHHAHAETYVAHDIAIRPSDLNSIGRPGDSWDSGNYRVRELVEAAPWEVLRRMSSTAGTALVDKLPSSMSWPLFVLMLIGFRRARELPWRTRLLALIAASVAFYAPFFVMRRFFLPLLPLLLIGSAAGLEVLAHRIDARRTRSIWTILTVLTAVLSLADTLSSGARGKEPRVYREAGLWLHEHLGAHDDVVLVGRKPQPAFYGECRYVRLLDTNVGDLRGALTAAGATHFFLDDTRFYEAHAEILPWIEVGGEPTWLVDRVDIRSPGEHLVLWTCDL